MKDTVTVKDAPMKPKDLRVVFSIATEDLPTVLGVLTGIATFISAGPLDGRESREQVVPASPAILAPIPSPSVSVPRAAVPKSPNHASFNRTKQRGGLRIYDWLLLRMLESDELTGEELGTALVQVGYAATSASPTLTALERNELVEVVKRGRKSRIRLTPHGKREGERLASLMGGSYTQIVSGVR